jgi:hypothetical protein
MSSKKSKPKAGDVGKKAETRAKSNTRPKGSKASPSPTPGDQGPAPQGEAPPKEPLTEKNVGEDAKATAADDTALDGRPRTIAGAKAVIHPIPHVAGVKHLPGEEPDPKAQPDPNLEQTLWGLRVAGRLYTVRHPDRKSLMIEADDEQCAREAAEVEYKALEKREGKERAETPQKVQLVDPAPRQAPFVRENIRVRKLTA